MRQLLFSKMIAYYNDLQWQAISRDRKNKPRQEMNQGQTTEDVQLLISMVFVF